MSHGNCRGCGAALTSSPRQYCSRQCSATSHARPLAERFWAKVVKGDGCWEWVGAISQYGYGTISTGGGRTIQLLAHRVSWEMHNGEIPASMQVCHRCDNRKCVRPDHMFLGDAAENQFDKVRKGRQAKGERVARAKLTVAIVQELRARFAAGASNDCALAREYGVGRAAERRSLAGGGMTQGELVAYLVDRCVVGFDNHIHWMNFKKKWQPEIDALPKPLRRTVEAAWENSGPKGL